MNQDFIFILQWWITLLLIGIIFLPLTHLLFSQFKDSFYVFSKVLGIGIISYTLLVLGTFHILPFNIYSIYFVLFIFLLINLYIFKKVLSKNIVTSKIIVFEEILFFSGLCMWAFIRAHEPSIQSLEKFMDYGFVNSILRSDYFPPKDMWFAPFSINYYFFGHLSTAVLTKLSQVPNYISYNVMLATLFAFTLTGGFSLVFNFLQQFGVRKSFLGGVLGGVLLSLSGNIHTLYSLFMPYTGEKPTPPWNLSFLPVNFPNDYWYPNATRFIPFTIHEFPLYSFVVSDLHGHVLDIPFVLFVIALGYSLLSGVRFKKVTLGIISLFLAILYMTNVWDGIIYFGLISIILFVLNLKTLTFSLQKTGNHISFPYIKNVLGLKKTLLDWVYTAGIVLIFYVIFSLPFNINFKPFVSGIGVICAPDFLTNIGKLGPFLFEKDHCQKSELYQLFILYGFFIFFTSSFITYLFIKTKKIFRFSQRKKLYIFSFPKNLTNFFILILILLSFLLILTPEFLYAKDIYPAHYRANTMFKLVYQAFILLTLTSTYAMVFLLTKIKNIVLKILFLVITFLLLVAVLIYPYFAIKSYYGDLQKYKGLNGNSYIKNLNPDDLEVITFLNTYIPGQPVILEAQGDSYTNTARISANTGLPTVLGWTVHEWLWRGSYDIPAPRINDVKTMYEGDLTSSLPLFKKHKVSYVIIGEEERQKYTIQEEKFKTIGKELFRGSTGKTVLYQITY